MNWTKTDEQEENISIQGVERTNIQRYFKDVGDVYDKNNNDYDIEFIPENRDKLIEMNLKCVIKIAKGYMGNGLTLDELISAGNEGLVKAYDKYKPDRSKYAQGLIGQIMEMDGMVSQEWIHTNVASACEYGDPMKQYRKTFMGPKAKSEYPKEFVIGWIRKNIKNASFNSVAMMWVTASIRQALDNTSRLIRKPVSLIKKEKTGESPKEHILDINQTISDDGNTTLGDVLYVPDTTPTELDQEDHYEYMHDLITKLFMGVKLRDRRIVMKRFGIGHIRPLQPKEIAEMEHISVARVSQIINIALSKMRNNAETMGLDKNEIYRFFEDPE